MNKDEKKFTLFAYEKGNIENRQPIFFIDQKGKSLEKTLLASIDSSTSRITKEKLYTYLLNKGVIKKEQTEFVIYCNEKSKDKNIIKQIPVIFNDYNIQIYSEYLLGNSDEEHTNKFKTLNSNTFWNFVDLIDDDSEKYDRLNVKDRLKFINGDSFSSEFTRLPFALTSFRKRVQDRVLGFFKDVDHQRVKDDKKLNFANKKSIEKDISESYRNFRDTYIFIRNYFSKDKINLEEEYRDLPCKNYDDLFEVRKTKSEEVKKVIEEKKEEQPIEINYNFNDLERILTTGYFRVKQSFSEFASIQKYLPEKVKTYIYRAYQCDPYLNDDVNEYLSKLVVFDSKHPDIISKLVSEYYKYMDDKLEKSNDYELNDLLDDYYVFKNHIGKVIK